jgi:hypothetical protein
MESLIALGSHVVFVEWVRHPSPLKAVTFLNSIFVSMGEKTNFTKTNVVQDHEELVKLEKLEPINQVSILVLSYKSRMVIVSDFELKCVC